MDGKKDKADSIRMTRRNINKGHHIGERTSRKRKDRKRTAVYMVFAFLAIGAFFFLCIVAGKKLALTHGKKNSAEESADFIAGQVSKEGNNGPGNDIVIENDKPIGQGELIGFSLGSQYEKQWVLLKEVVTKELESAGFRTKVLFSENTEGIQTESLTKEQRIEKQKNNIMELSEQGAQLIFTSVEDTAALGDVLDRVKEKGTIVVALDRLPVDTSDIDYYLGCDDLSIGKAQAEFTVSRLKETHVGSDHVNVEILTTDMSDRRWWYLYPGVFEVLYPDIDRGWIHVPSGQLEIEQTSVENGSRENARSRMSEILKTCYADKTELDAVICTDDALAAGVVDAITSAMADGSYTGSMPIITGDGSSEDALERVRSGHQTMTLWHDPDQYGKAILNMTLEVVQGKPVNVNDTETFENGAGIIPAVRIKPVAVTAENYQHIIEERGYHQVAVLID